MIAYRITTSLLASSRRRLSCYIKPDTELGQRAMRAISSKELFDSSTAKKYLKALDDEGYCFS